MSRRRDVRDTYDRIASHFSKTRKEPWSEVESFLAGKRGRIGLDIGVGNGRHAALLAGRTDLVIGLDVSVASLDEAIARSADVGFDLRPVLGDAAYLPVRDRQVDVAVYIATIHHLPTRTLRIRSLDELERVLTPTGTALVSAWSTTHERFDRRTGFDATIDWTLPDGTTVPRYYHIYDPTEFRRDLTASNVGIESVFESHGNCYAVVSSGT